MMLCPVDMYFVDVPLRFGRSIMPRWQSIWMFHWMFHMWHGAIYLTALVEHLYSVIVFILLGVSSRVCCLPAVKGKGVMDRP